MTVSTMREVLGELKRTLSPSSREYLERVVQRPEVQRVLTADEEELVAERVKLVEQLRTAPKRREADMTKAWKAHHAAIARREAAERSLREARDAETLTYGAHIAADYGLEREVGDLQKQLREGADPRIGQALQGLRGLWPGRINQAWQIGIAYGAHGEHSVVSNKRECDLAGAAVCMAIRACQDMELMALGSADVEAQLGAVFDGLRRPLAGIGLAAPRIQNGEVVVPFNPVTVTRTEEAAQ